MKNLLAPLEASPPVPANAGDGMLAFAADHLRAVKYPNRMNDIAVLGRLRDWHRSFLLRPRYGGRFLFLMYPKDSISRETVIERPFRVQSFNSAPVLIDVTVPARLRLFRLWEWRVVKTGVADETEDRFEDQDALAIPADGMLSGRSSAGLAQAAWAERSYSTLIYQIRASMFGTVAFDQEATRAESRLAMWSCHQPYASEDGVAVVKRDTERILDWYRGEMGSFAPHMVWMLGDSVYSDGTGTLDFVRQVYDQRGWQDSDAKRKDLLSLYRLNYRYHWSFPAMQAVMRRFPHLGMWDDHEIRDGYGSEESDFRDGNIAIKQIAAQAAEEYLFQYSPTLRSESTRNSSVDNHQAYVSNTVAAFIFDGRNSRNYGENMPVPSEVPVLASALAGLVIGALTGGVAGAAVGALTGTAAGVEIASEIVDIYRWHNPGEVVSELQLQDFQRFCDHIKGSAHVKYLLLGNSVPFIYILDFVENIAAESAIAGTDTGQNMRDDIRDSWHSPANRRQLSRLVDILRDLHRARPDLEIVNVSGDIHLSNAFAFHPDGFSKPLFQVTSSALTNDPPSAASFLNLVSVDGPLSVDAKSDIFGKMSRLWQDGSGQNFLTVRATVEALELHLHMFDSADPTSAAKDRVLTIRPSQGYVLEQPTG